MFFRDGGDAIRGAGFLDITYADDLNAFKTYPVHTCPGFLHQDMRVVQQDLHLWGEANGVRFDASKESFHILSRSVPVGNNFKMLGIQFDPKLLCMTLFTIVWLLATGSCNPYCVLNGFTEMQISW